MSLTTEENNDEAVWADMITALVDFGLSRSTAARLAGLPHVTPGVVARWLAYCRLRGRDSRHGTNAFLITRLTRNDIPAPSWGALRRLEARYAEGGNSHERL